MNEEKLKFVAENIQKALDGYAKSLLKLGLAMRNVRYVLHSMVDTVVVLLEKEQIHNPKFQEKRRLGINITDGIPVTEKGKELALAKYGRPGETYADMLNRITLSNAKAIADAIETGIVKNVPTYDIIVPSGEQMEELIRCKDQFAQDVEKGLHMIKATINYNDIRAKGDPLDVRPDIIKEE